MCYTFLVFSVFFNPFMTGPLSYRNQSIDLQSKSLNWFLYDNGLRHERVKECFNCWQITFSKLGNYILMKKCKYFTCKPIRGDMIGVEVFCEWNIYFCHYYFLFYNAEFNSNQFSFLLQIRHKILARPSRIAQNVF